MIKYIGSKRRLVPVLGGLASACGARSAVDLFTGTTRVAQELKARGIHTTAVDTARYSEIFSRCYIETDSADVDIHALDTALGELQALPGRAGYVTETFCRASRFFQPFNGERIDAIRDAIETGFAGSPLFPLLLTSLIEAADRVDSTTGVQMAYVKQWAARSFNPLELRRPALLAGTGRALRGDASELASRLGSFDFAYLDPPYNQHRYYSNYHIWETLTAWDAPDHYGVACKRSDVRDPSTRSPFNSKRDFAATLSSVVHDIDARVLVLSYNDESWVELGELEEMCSKYETVASLRFDSKRYVGAQIGIHDPRGVRVGTVSHMRNLEYLVVAGPRGDVKAMCEPHAVHAAAG